MIALGHYVPTKHGKRVARYRWLLGIIGDKASYSTGGNTHRICSETAFKRWIKKHDARLSTADDQPNIVMR